MKVKICAPEFQESISEGTLVAWQQQTGEAVSRDTLLAEIETDKVVLDVVAPADGSLTEILRHNGETVRSGDVIAYFETAAGATEKPDESAAGTQHPVVHPAAAEEQPPAAEVSMSAAVRRMVEENSLNAALIPATGRNGRLIKADVLAYLKTVEDAAAEMPSAADDARPEKRVAMSRLRARVAERMLAASRNTAMLTTFNEVDLHEVIAVRRQCQEEFQQLHGVKLGIMSFFVRAAIAALQRFPTLNASIDGNEIVYHGYFDIGVAVATERGLVVPVLRDADSLNLADIERSIADFGSRAREGKLRMEEIQGGTFTISNGGVFGSLMSTPILNPPQSGILGMHAIRERPVAIDGRVDVRPMMYLALSYDHRLVDGREAVQFLTALRDQIEQPARLLLNL